MEKIKDLKNRCKKLEEQNQQLIEVADFLRREIEHRDNFLKLYAKEKSEQSLSGSQGSPKLPF